MKPLLVLFTLLFSLSSFAQEQTSAPSSSNENNLRKREHAMSWRLSSIAQKAENKDSGVTSKTSNVEMKFSYLYNFSRFELGGTFATERAKDEDTGAESTSSSLSLMGHFNFIENKPGNDVVPYLSGSLGALNMKPTTTEYSGSTASLGLGLFWFPLSEIFAFNAELNFAAASIKGGTPEIKVDVTQTVLGVGWAFYF